MVVGGEAFQQRAFALKRVNVICERLLSALLPLRGDETPSRHMAFMQKQQLPWSYVKGSRSRRLQGSAIFNH